MFPGPAPPRPGQGGRREVHTGHPQAQNAGLGSGQQKDRYVAFVPSNRCPIQLGAGHRRPPGLSVKFCSPDFLVRKYRKGRGLGAANQEPDPSGLQPPAPHRPHTEWPCVGWPGLEALARACERQLPGCASHVGGEGTGSPWLSWLPLCSPVEVGCCCPGNRPLPPQTVP